MVNAQADAQVENRVGVTGLRRCEAAEQQEATRGGPGPTKAGKTSTGRHQPSL